MKRGTVAVLVLLVAVSVAATGGRATGKRRLSEVGFRRVLRRRALEPKHRGADPSPVLEGRQGAGGPGPGSRFVPPNQDPTGALERLARQNYDLIIVAYPGSPEALARIAEKFPRVRFMSPGVPIEAFAHPPRNFQGSDYRAEEAAYLAGYLAALMEDRRPGKHVISAVGGIPYSGVTRWTDGYKAGAKKADLAISVLIGYSNDFSNPAKCRRVALSQIAKGSGAVFNVAGACGLGTLRAAKDEGVWGVGVDIDQSYPRPARPHECHLASRSRGVRRRSQPCARGPSRPERTAYSTCVTAASSLATSALLSHA